MTDANENEPDPHEADEALQHLAEMLRGRVVDLDRQLDEEPHDDGPVWAFNQLVETYRRVLKDLQAASAAGHDGPVEASEDRPIWTDLDDRLEELETLEDLE